MQVQELTHRLLPIARASHKSKATAGQETIEVSTVDGFHGREKEVLVISTVRCNGQGRLGFLTDGRRMNVAFVPAGAWLSLGVLKRWEPIDCGRHGCCGYAAQERHLGC